MRFNFIYEDPAYIDQAEETLAQLELPQPPSAEDDAVEHAAYNFQKRKQEIPNA
jgi:hypothetical protein